MVNYYIYGPIEDVDYWEKCKLEIKEFPNNINVVYKGVISNSEIEKAFLNSHNFLSLTLGENFGHSISESIFNSKPVIISDKTPLLNLEEKGIGFDLSLDNNQNIISKLQFFVDMDNEEYNKTINNVINFCENELNQDKIVESYYKMLT